MGVMKRVKYGDEAVIVGDEFGALLLRYAAALARNDTAEPLHFTAVNSEGEVAASFLLGPASQLTVMETHSDLPEPDNSEAEAKMRERLKELSFPVPHPVEDDRSSSETED
jgi:hypothetical protein